MPGKSPFRKVLLIGWDAADWKVIMPLVDAGKMPNVARLLEEGVCGNLATLQPVLSPMLWTSIATGKRPYKHGILGFSEPDPVSGGIRPVTNLSRKTKAIWNILNQNGLNTTTIGWWPSNPVEQLSRGVMVSNDYQNALASTPDRWPLKPGTIHPASLEKTLAELRFHPAELTEAELRPFLPGLQGMSREDLDKAEKDPRMQSLAKTIADCTSIHSAATYLMEKKPWDFMAVYYDAIDHFGHSFMRYHPPRQKHVDDWEFRVFNHCLEAGYRYHDMMLGTLLRMAGGDTTVILMSDHGFHPDHLRPSNIPREPTGPAIEHRQFGIFVAKGPGIRKDERIYGASLLDICPTLLHLFGLPVGEDMDGKVLFDIYESNPPDVLRVPSWDDVTGDHGMHPEDKQISAGDSKAALEQLVALGYIAEPNPDATKALDETVRELDYHLAQACMDGGVFNQAADVLERLYATWPMEHRFGFKLAACYQALDRASDLRRLVATLVQCRLEEATHAREMLIALKLDDPEVQKSELARIEKMPAAERRNFGRERSELISKARPNFFAFRYLEACADVAEKRYAAALEKLEPLENEPGARRVGLVLRGEICQRLHRWEDSRVAFEEALEIDPESPGPLLGLARTALKEKDFKAAVRYSKESIGLVFFQPRAHYIHGLAQYRLQNWEEAEHAFLLCVRQAPLFSAAFRLLGEIARWHKKDVAESALYQFKAHEARRKLVQLRDEKIVEASPITPSSIVRPMPELRSRAESLAGVPTSAIITVVSGLPRSGTSLMMQILAAAGIRAYTDHNRTADESNRNGYFEHDNAATLLSRLDRSWLIEARGAAIKIVAPLLTALPRELRTPDSQPDLLHYRVIFMERGIEEILQSQNAMLKRLGKSTAGGEAASGIGKAFQQQERHARNWCLARGIHSLAVNYHALVHTPEKILPLLAAFLGIPDKFAAMHTCIDPALYRSRANPTQNPKKNSAD